MDVYERVARRKRVLLNAGVCVCVCVIAETQKAERNVSKEKQKQRKCQGGNSLKLKV